MAKILLALCILAFARPDAFAQQDKDPSGRSVSVILQEATTAVRSAQANINASKPLVAQVADLVRRDDKEGVRKIFIANGAPAYTDISIFTFSAANPERIEMECSFEYAPAAMHCTIGW